MRGRICLRTGWKTHNRQLQRNKLLWRLPALLKSNSLHRILLDFFRTIQESVMFRRKELIFIVLVQAAITLILSSVTPNSGIIHPHMERTANSQPYFQHQYNSNGF
jgi:hypothetical protein